MLESLTPDQETLIDKIASEYEKNALSGNDDYDVEKIVKGVDFLYKLADLKPPQIFICPSPMDMVEVAELEKGQTIDYLGNGYDSGWTAFYDFFERIGIKFDKEYLFKEWLDFIRYSGVFATLLYENVAFVCIRPCEVHLKEFNLHNENGMAIKWRDGFGIYFLNGIEMKEEYILTPSEKMSPGMVMKEENADVRRELIRKFGVDRLKKFGKLIDKQGDYELLDMAKIFLSVNYAPHLLMKNPSIGVWHLEGVSQECKTVQDAINWRAGDIKTNWQPSVLT